MDGPIVYGGTGTGIGIRVDEQGFRQHLGAFGDFDSTDIEKGESSRLPGWFPPIALPRLHEETRDMAERTR
jgi:hypothetical protein